MYIERKQLYSWTFPVFIVVFPYGSVWCVVLMLQATGIKWECGLDSRIEKNHQAKCILGIFNQMFCVSFDLSFEINILLWKASSILGGVVGEYTAI